MTLPFFFALSSALALPRDETPQPGLNHAPPSKNTPIWRDGPAGVELAPAPAMPQARKLFGIGVGFVRIGNTQGIALSTVLAGSPAERAGLTAGVVIAEINGERTTGKTGDACAQLIRDAGPVITIRFFDLGTLRLQTLKLEKESLSLP